MVMVMAWKLVIRFLRIIIIVGSFLKSLSLCYWILLKKDESMMYVHIYEQFDTNDVSVRYWIWML